MIKKGEYNNLNSSDRRYYQAFIARCKGCTSAKECKGYANFKLQGKADYVELPRRQVPIIVDNNGRTELWYKFCGKEESSTAGTQSPITKDAKTIDEIMGDL